MKNSGFKMKGYTYPGTSPMKGAQAKRDAGRAKADDAQEAMSGAFDNQFSAASGSGMPMKEKYAPMRKVSPAKVAGATALGLTETLKTAGADALKASLTTAANAGVNALVKGKNNENKQTTATMNQSFGSTSIA